MNKKVVLGGLVLVVAVAACWIYWPRGEASPDPRKLADQIASGKAITFGNGSTSLNAMAKSPAGGYFALPAGPQRVAYLDKMIDEQESTRKKIASGEIKMPPGFMPTTKPAHGEEGPKGPTSVEEKTSADGTQKSVTVRLNADDLSPDLRAELQEFAAALANRRKERGLDPDAPMMIIRSEYRTTPAP